MYRCRKCSATVSEGQEICSRCASASTTAERHDPLPAAVTDPAPSGEEEEPPETNRAGAITPGTIEREPLPRRTGRLGFKVGVGAAVAIGLFILLTDTKFEYGELVWTVGGTFILAPVAGFVMAAIFWYVAFLVDPVAGLFSKPPEEVSKALDRYEEEEEDATWYEDAGADHARIQAQTEQGAPEIPRAMGPTETDQGIKPKEPDR